MDSVIFTTIGASIALVVAILNWSTSSRETEKWDKRIYQYVVFLAAVFTVYGTWRGFLLNEEKTRAQVDVELQNDWLHRKQLQDRLQYERELRTQARELVKKSDEIAKLNREIKLSVTEGDSYGFLVFMTGDGSSNTPRMIFSHVGKYPLYDVVLHITDMEKLKSVLPGGRFFATNEEQFRFMEKLEDDVRQQIELGTVVPGRSVRFRNGWKLPEREKITYSMKISSRFQTFYQNLKLQRVNGRWMQAFRIFKHDANNKLQVLRESVPKDFPRDEPGELFWMYR